MLDLEETSQCVEKALDALIRSHFAITIHLVRQRQHAETLEFSGELQSSLKALQPALEPLLKAVQDAGGGGPREGAGRRSSPAPSLKSEAANAVADCSQERAQSILPSMQDFNEVDSALPKFRYPMYCLRVWDFLSMDLTAEPLPPHQEMLKRGLLTTYTAGMNAFLSGTWTSSPWLFESSKT